MNKKVFILLPDGVGLRNFAFTQFNEIGRKEGFDIVYWNNTVFDITSVGIKEVKIQNAKLHPFTDILKNAKIHIGLNQFIKRTNDVVYDTYRFPFSGKTIKTKLKKFITKSVINQFNSDKGFISLNKKIKQLERKTAYYKSCKETLEKERPAFVFCTNQRIVTAIAPLLAAQDLGIPTGTFIFSWDNLPKATMVVDTDYYFVWSDFMKNELLSYYPYINKNQVLVTGTPQFEPHFDENHKIDKKVFFNQYGLDIAKKYICFSGDDVTTSPDDEQYLADVAKAVEKLNDEGANLGVIFRRCPVDFSGRYDSVIKKYSDIIKSIDPLWKQNGDTWNTVMPTVEDVKLQVNIIANSELVVNIASSMVFDFVSFNKPCLYVNYDVVNSAKPDWSSKTVYKFVHFRSMPDKNAVIWLNSNEEIAAKLKEALSNASSVPFAKKWFEKINQHPPQEASYRIWKEINTILNNE
jgi:hypothetical protein